ncbi:MAG: hypothetical protein AMJ61_12890 [Desulfobacterales bacterium SG8_35_2]|jgi:hypothetical protein|nr:MAG: hypothetical protein AMJ61_12890 [Desulfobacterales bacterium SG8_35_2]
MNILQGLRVREVNGKLLWRRNVLICSGPGQWLIHISGIWFTSKKEKNWNQEQDKNNENN